ncbi:MAG: 5'/3'-nucleotidase SurE [Pseudomonadota bacterium]
MRILITNDDGINAPGLDVLEAIANELAGPDGEVWIVAPAFEQSGVGHCISYVHPTLVAKLGPRRFTTEGTPADCVLAALYDILKDTPPDLILSGVNRGNNSAENVLYSGTIGAAMEGALQGYKSIALSQYYGPRNAEIENSFEAAAQHGVALVRALLDHAPWDEGADYKLFYNVNFPPVPGDEVLGTLAAEQGFRRETNFGIAPHTAPSGRRFMWITGGPQNIPTAPGSDAAVNLEGYISVTPLRANLTDFDTLGPLQKALDGVAKP